MVHCVCYRLFCACNRMAVGLIYMVGFITLDA